MTFMDHLNYICGEMLMGTMFGSMDPANTAALMFAAIGRLPF